MKAKCIDCGKVVTVKAHRSAYSRHSYSMECTCEGGHGASTCNKKYITGPKLGFILIRR